jgi:hypothetical protein
MHDILASRSPHGWGGGEGEGLVVLYVGFGVEWASWPNKGLSIEWAPLAFVVRCTNDARQIVFFAMRLSIDRQQRPLWHAVLVRRMANQFYK